MTDPIVNLWTAQQSEARGLSRAELEQREALLRRRVFRRDIVEYAAGALVIAAFGRIALVTPDWGIRIASAVLIAGTLLVMWNLWQRRPKDDPAALARDAHAHYRARLVAQRDTLASVGRWYLGPMVPGMILFLAATMRAIAQTMPLSAALVVGTIAATIVGGIFLGVWWLNARAARALDTEIAALDATVDTVIT